MVSSKHSFPRLALPAAVSTALVMSGPVVAQELEEVVVTATKREERDGSAPGHHRAVR